MANRLKYIPHVVLSAVLGFAATSPLASQTAGGGDRLILSGDLVGYSVTAKDSRGRTGEWKPFEAAASQLTIVE
jgi:selenophosphate synthetase-related protein